MHNIYMAVYKCKSLTNIGMPGYNDVMLGLSMGSGASIIMIKGTVARFQVGKEYIISIGEKDELL